MVEMDAVAQGVVASDGNQGIDAQEVQVFQDFIGQVVRLGVVFGPEMLGHVDIGNGTRPRPGRVKERPAGASGLVDRLFGQDLVALVVHRALVPDHFDEPGPSPPDAVDPVALVKRAEGHRADRGIESGNVSASGQDADVAFLAFRSHGDLLVRVKL